MVSSNELINVTLGTGFSVFSCYFSIYIGTFSVEKKKNPVIVKYYNLHVRTLFEMTVEDIKVPLQLLDFMNFKKF